MVEKPSFDSNVLKSSLLKFLNLNLLKSKDPENYLKQLKLISSLKVAVSFLCHICIAAPRVCILAPYLLLIYLSNFCNNSNPFLFA